MNDKHPVISIMSGIITAIVMIIVPLFIMKWIIISFSSTDIFVIIISLAVASAFKLKDKDLI